MLNTPMLNKMSNKAIGLEKSHITNWFQSIDDVQEIVKFICNAF